MPPEHEARRRLVLDAERARALEEPVHRRAVERAGPRPWQSDFASTRQQLEVDLLREPPERAVADLVAHLVPHARLQVVRDDAEHLRAHVVAVDRVDVEPVEQRGRGATPASS